MTKKITVSRFTLIGWLCWALVIGIWAGRWGEKHHPFFVEPINECLSRQIWKENVKTYADAVKACAAEGVSP